jgi:chromate reductase
MPAHTNKPFETDIPKKVKEFKSKIRNADAILIVTPEHDYSAPGILKNAIDFESRLYGDNKCTCECSSTSHIVCCAC